MRIALPIAYFQTILLNVVCRVESAQGDKIISAHRQEPDERSMATQTSPWGSMGSEGGLKHWVRRWLPYNCGSFFGVSASSCLISVRLILDHFWLWLIVNDKLVAARSFFIPTLSVLASLGSTLVAIGVWCMICQYVQSNFARTSCQSIFLASHCHCSIWFRFVCLAQLFGRIPNPRSIQYYIKSRTGWCCSSVSPFQTSTEGQVKRPKCQKLQSLGTDAEK